MMTVSVDVSSSTVSATGWAAAPRLSWKRAIKLVCWCCYLWCWNISVTLQCLWRCHAAEYKSRFHATWRIHEQDSVAGHHTTNQFAKSLGRLARRTTGSFSVTSRKAWPARRISRGSMMDPSDAAMAGSRELSRDVGAAGDTFDTDEPIPSYTSPTAGISWFNQSHD